MTRHVKGIALAGGASIAALALLLTPALAASSQDPAKAPAKRPPVVSFYSGSFTPAIADPRLAAEFARRGVQSDTFRFTPSSASPGKSKAVKVAIRARLQQWRVDRHGADRCDFGEHGHRDHAHRL